ncbi:hypothetical protein D3C85_1566210 [compost metagenome]
MPSWLVRDQSPPTVMRCWTEEPPKVLDPCAARPQTVLSKVTSRVRSTAGVRSSNVNWVVVASCQWAATDPSSRPKTSLKRQSRLTRSRCVSSWAVSPITVAE